MSAANRTRHSRLGDPHSPAAHQPRPWSASLQQDGRPGAEVVPASGARQVTISVGGDFFLGATEG